MPALTAAQIAEICGGVLTGDGGLVITGANTLEQAGPEDLAFAANRKGLEKAQSCRAACLLVPESFSSEAGRTLIRVADPRAAFARALAGIYAKARPAGSIHPTAIVAESAKIGAECVIGAYVTIGEQTEIGAGCVIGAGCRVGEHVFIGEDSTLHANVAIYDNVRIGTRAILHSGCVLGADGFGFVLSGDHYEKFPQVGSVDIGDDVEIGANSCVDRGALGATHIGDGTKIDNLVHVGHNCSIGKHVVIAAQTGFSGSVTVGDYAVIGGQVGIGEKAQIEAKAVVGGQAGVLVSQRVRAGEPVWGTPARPLRKYLKNLAQVGKIGELREEVREIREKLQKPASGALKRPGARRA
ncbi:MAG: UDP-3-O-(3-hydroxymyristoyl)glucosamine N-acyltransferase [Bryobacteraceae bacterium]